MAEYKISLGVKLNTADINSQIEKFSNNNAKKIKIEFNTKTIQSQLNSIRKQIQNLSNIKVNLNINGTGIGGSNVNAGIGKAIQEQSKLAQTSVQTANIIAQSGKKIQSAYNQISNARNLDGLNLKDDISDADRLSAALNKLSNIQKNIGKIEVGKIDTSNGVQKLKVLEDQLESLTEEYNKTISIINGYGGVSATQFQSFQNQCVNIELELQRLTAEAEEARAKLAKKIEVKLEAGKFSTQVTKIKSDVGKLSDAPPDLQQKIKALNNAMDAMSLASKKGDINGLIEAYERFGQTLDNVRNKTKQIKIAEQDKHSLDALEQNKKNLSLDMDNWLKNNSAAAKDFGAKIQELKARIDACDATQLDGLKREFQTVKREAQLAGKNTQSFGDQLKAQFAKYKSYISVATAFMYISQGLRDMFEQVKLIDSAMTELKKVTNETDAAYNQFLTNAASRAKEIGTTVDGLVSSTADFARLGYDFADAQGLAEVANIYAVVGDDIDSVDTATQSLISTLTAFKNEMGDMDNSEFALSIVDKMNEVANNFAISSGGIGDALQRSASSMMAANNSLDETIALITAANTVVNLCHAA